MLHNPVWRANVTAFRKLAQEEGRELSIWGNAIIAIRDTDEEAQEFFHGYSEETVDTATIDSFLATMSEERNMPPGSPQYEDIRRMLKVGLGLSIVGSAATVAARLAEISNAGFDGVLISAVDAVQAM